MESDFELALRVNEEAIRHAPVESLYAFDASGRLVLVKTGGPREIEATFLEVSRLRDTVLTHNHPGGKSFSLDDVQVAMIGDVAELRVVTADRRFRLQRPTEGWNLEFFKQSVVPAYQR